MGFNSRYSQAEDTVSGGEVPSSRVVGTGWGLTGGGDLTVNRTLAIANNPFTAGSVPFSDGANFTQDNAALFWNAANDQLGIGINTFPATTVKLRVGNPGLSGGLTQLDGAVGLGVTTSGTRFASASPYLSFVCGSYLDSQYDGGGNGGLYAIARAGVAGNPPTKAPFSALSGYDEGTSRSLYFGGGGWGAPDANDLVFYTSPTYSETTDTGVLRMHINTAGQVMIGTVADTTGSLHVQGAIGSVALRVSSGSPSRIGTGGLNVGTDANPTAGFLFDQKGAGGSRFARSAATTGAASNFLYVGAAHTGQTASVETPDVDINGSATLQHATGALATQRQVVVRARTYSFVGASTITNAATLAIDNAPVAGTNATITNRYALWVQAGLSKFDAPPVLPSYTVAGVPSAAPAGQMAYITDETGGAVPAFSDGTNWRRVTDRAIIA